MEMMIHSYNKNHRSHFIEAAESKFILCPSGLGFDTYRLWECFYFKVIPIVLNSTFNKLIKKKYNLPMIILNEWTDLINIELKYKDFDNSILDFNILKEEILNSYYNYQ